MEFINENANIFFFVTTIFVAIMIIAATVLLALCIKFYSFMRRITAKIDAIVEDNKTNEFVKRAVPIILPVLSFFFKGKKRKK